MDFKWENREKFIESYKTEGFKEDVLNINRIIAEKMANQSYIKEVLVSPGFYDTLIVKYEKDFKINASKFDAIYGIPVKIDYELEQEYKIIYN